jgi:hypothetical protein
MATAGNTLSTRMQGLGHAPRLTVYNRTSGSVKAVCTECGELGEILSVRGDQMSGSVMRGAATTCGCVATRLMAAR